MAALCMLLSACPDPHFEGCGRGHNMSNVRLADGFDALADTPTLVILWDPVEGIAARLPDAYFADVAVARETDPVVEEVILDLELTGVRELTVRFRDLAGYLSLTDQLTLVLEFPDRWDHLDCYHRGMDDRYLLTVELVIGPDGAITYADLVQGKELGPI